MDSLSVYCSLISFISFVIYFLYILYMGSAVMFLPSFLILLIYVFSIILVILTRDDQFWSFQGTSFWFCWFSVLNFTDFCSDFYNAFSSAYFAFHFVCSFSSFLSDGSLDCFRLLLFASIYIQCCNFPFIHCFLLCPTHFGKLCFDLVQNILKFVLKIFLWTMYLEVCCLIPQAVWDFLAIFLLLNLI